MNFDTKLEIEIFMIFIMIINLVFIFLLYKNRKEKSPQVKPSSPEKVDIKYLTDLKGYLDKLIKEKFDYLLINNILPLYYAGKKLDKNTVTDLQKEFFIRISFNLSKELKKELKKHFNEEGIKFYIDEKFLTYLNKIDKMTTENNQVSPKDLSSLIK